MNAKPPQTAADLLVILRAIKAGTLDADVADWGLDARTLRGIRAGVCKAVEALEAAGIS